MEIIELPNPFDAPVYYEEIVDSTMDSSRSLAAKGAPHGTVILADFQQKGRGRQGRPWVTEKGQNLMFTVLLRYTDINAFPKALSLRSGLAAALAIEEFIPAMAGSVLVKWPNDIMLGKIAKAKKAAGILVESDGANVFIGMGVNLLQNDFPKDLYEKAVSLFSFFNENFPEFECPMLLAKNEAPLMLLEKILANLHCELAVPKTPPLNSWNQRLLSRLYKLGHPVIFAEGASDSHKILKGRLDGIGEDGELIVTPDGKSKPMRFINGELRVY